MAVKRVLHININCRDLQRSRAFYETLGFEPIRPAGGDPGKGDPADVEQDREAMAKAMRLPTAVTRGLLMKSTDDPRATVIELLEWTDPPLEGAAYGSLNHAGAARIALLVDDLDATVEMLRTSGAELLSEPVSVSMLGGVRFVVVVDPDGVFIELAQPVGYGTQS